VVGEAIMTTNGITTAVLCAVVFGLAYGWQNERLAHQDAIKQAAAVGDARRDDFDMQAKCADQAERVFKLWGYDDPGARWTYESNYNHAANKCFVKMVTWYKGIQSVEIIDAYSKKAYGYLAIKEDQPLMCYVEDSTGDLRTRPYQAVLAHGDFRCRRYLNFRSGKSESDSQSMGYANT
jgi:hypothetical protein